MFSSQLALNNGLTFLAYSTGIIFILISVFLIKLLIDLSRLTKNLDTTLNMVKSELEPTLQEVKASLQSINSFVKSADQRVNSLKNTVLGGFGIGMGAISKLKNASGSIVNGALKGFTTILKLFSK